MEDREHRLNIRRRRKAALQKYAIVISLILILGIGGIVIVGSGKNLSTLFNRLPEVNSIETSAGTTVAGGAGHQDNSTVFMSYAGPLFPLSIAGGGVGITASRNITFDFSGFDETDVFNGIFLDSVDIIIEDIYTLENESADEIAIEIFYPFAGSFRTLYKLQPVIDIDSNELKTMLKAGSGLENFASSGGLPDEMDNFTPINSWESYAGPLSDEKYLNHALESEDALNRIVTVYELTNAQAVTGDVWAPTLAADFNLDFDKTTVLTFGFHGADADKENGHMRQSFFVPDPRRYGRSYYLIVIGDDIDNLVIQGYESAGCVEGEEYDGVTADVTKYEAVLSDILTKILDDYMSNDYGFIYGQGEPQIINKALDNALLYKQTAELLRNNGALSGNMAYRYNSGWLEIIFMDIITMRRIFFLAAEIRIPAGGSITLVAKMVKQGSFDNFCTDEDNTGIYGYDMLAKTGPDMAYDSLTAEIVDAGRVDIVRQNFGFDIANGILSVELNPDTPHYYLEVRGIANVK
jgi:hypothetical protein